MAGEDPTNKPDTRSDLRADPNPDAGQRPEPEQAPELASGQAPEQAPDQTSEPVQKDAPLPAFIYGRDGRGDSQGRNNRSADRQNFNAWIGDMDRKTLLGLITGAGMLGLVLFFAGMLVGAGLFMDSNDPETVAQNDRAPVEMLATEPDEPSVSAPMPQSEPTTVSNSDDTAGAGDDTVDDPVGDLIAERTDALPDTETQTDTPSADDVAADNNASASGTSGSEPMDAPAAPAAPDPNAASDDNALSAPEIRDTAQPSANEAPAAEAQEPVAAPEKSTAAKEPAQKETASEPAASADTAAKPFSVQVGAFKVHENASQRAEELRKSGLEVAVVIRGPEGDGAWYYVRVGKYANLAQARDDAAKIKKNQGVDGFPVRAEPNDREVE